MLKFFSLGKGQGIIIITIMILISLGACYYFFYLPKNERTVQERRFRCLRKIDSSIRQKIETSKKQISHLIDEYDKYSVNGNNIELKKLEKYISGYPKKNFRLLLPDRADKYSNDTGLTYIGNDTAGNKFYMHAGSRLTLLVQKAQKNKNGGNPAGRKNKKATTIGIQFEFEQFIAPLLLKDVFDYYVVFINKDKIYEDYPTGLNYDKPDSLLNVQNKITTPGLRTLQIGETDYKVFSHPAYTQTNNKWIITGLLKNSNYRQEKNRLPVWTLLFLMTLAIVMLVSLPWIKLYHMGNKDKLTIKDGIASVVVSMILMSLLFFIIFKYRIDLKHDLLPYHDGKSKLIAYYPADSYSRNVLALKIKTAFEKEIKNAVNLVDNFRLIHDTTDADVKLLGQGGGKYDKLFKLYGKGLNVLQIYWLDTNGAEKTNLTTGLANDPKGNYQARDYFQDANNYAVNQQKFYLGQGFSYTTGAFRSVISQNTEDKNGVKDGVIAMTFNLKSLERVIMPDGYQFAIIDRSGRVLYHSRKNRQLLDNLLTEFGDSRYLVSSIEASSFRTIGNIKCHQPILKNALFKYIFSK